MSGVAGDGRKDESLESGFGRLASERGGAGQCPAMQLTPRAVPMATSVL